MQICGQTYKGCHKFNSKVIFKLTMSSTELTGYDLAMSIGAVVPF